MLLGHIESQYETALVENNLHLQTLDRKIAQERKKINQVLQNVKLGIKETAGPHKKIWEIPEMTTQHKRFLHSNK